MPLTELLRMPKRKVVATQLKPSTTNDPSCRGDTDCAELVWENGHIATQGQSSDARKVPSSSNFQTFVPKAQDSSKIGNGAKMSKLSSMDTVLVDFPLTVSSCGMGLDQDVDMTPWLNYPVEDPLHNDYTSDFLRELSGVTISDPTIEKNNGTSSAIDNMASLKYGSSGITGTNASNCRHVTSRDSLINQSSLYDFTSLRLQKMDVGQSSTSTSGFTNFPYFSRPASIARANNLTVNESNRLEGDDNRCTLTSTSSAQANSTVVNFSDICSQKEIVSCNQSLQTKPTEELGVCREDVTMKNASQDQSHGTALKKAKMLGERNKEPVLATSSVCSGSSVAGTSNEPSRDLKRKLREAVESDTPSDEAEEESVGARKGAPPKNSLKRSRAAEVHNLSERRRRDRINEKMRTLQELIPNCNKVDKASMLDEAIEYLKTLQLQLQMMSMGAGLYMQPMMVPPGMQQIHGAQMPHFSPMGVGMGMGMGLGMNMLNMNSSMKLMPFHSPQYPVVGGGPAFHVMAGSNLQPFGQHGQGIPMSMPQVPVPPMSCIPPLKTPMAASSNSKDVGTQSVPRNSVNSQVTNEGIKNPPPHNQAQPVNNSSLSAIASYGTDTTPS